MAPRRIQILEIGTSRLALAGFSSSHGAVRLESWESEAMEPGWTEGPQQFEQLLAKLTTFVARQPRHACTVLLPGHLVLTKIVSVASPESGGASLDPAEHIPLPLAEVVWGWAQVNAGDETPTALIAAARGVHVARLCEVITAAGLAIDRVLPCAVATLAALPRSGDAMAIASSDARSTVLAVSVGPRRLVRTIPIGTLTPPSARERLAGEIERTFAYWSETFGISAPAVLRIAGDGVENFVLGPALSLRVEPYRVGTEIASNAAVGISDPLGPAIAGATRAVLLPGEILIDLSPDALVRQRLKARRTRLGLAAAALVVAGLLPPLFFYRARAAEMTRRAEVLETDVRAVTALHAANTARWREVEHLRDRVRALQAAYQARDSWSRFLSELQGHLAAVDGAWIERLQVVANARTAANSAARRLLLGGRVPAVNGTAASDGAKQLLARLATLAFVAGLEGEQFESAPDGSLKFSVTLVLKPEPAL